METSTGAVPRRWSPTRRRRELATALVLLLVLAQGASTGIAAAPKLASPGPRSAPGSSLVSAAAASASPSASPVPSGTPAPSASVGPSAVPSPLPWPSASVAPSPTPTPRPQPLPRCTYADVITRDRDPDDWAITFLDTVYRLPTMYGPRDLVRTGVAGGGSVRRLVAGDLRAMARAATAAGAPIQIVSAYRSYAAQISDFAYWVRVSGLAAALLGSARPGHSEHQLGTTIDVTSLGGGLPWHMWDWGTTPAGRWMRQNSWRYGFVMSYPAKGSPAKTCYRYEPWHFRYVGREMAAAVRASGLTLREYLWRERSR